MTGLQTKTGFLLTQIRGQAIDLIRTWTPVMGSRQAGARAIVSGLKQRLGGVALGLSVLFASTSACAQAGLPPELARAWAQTKLPDSSLSVLVQEIGGPQLFALSPEVARNPASVMKLVINGYAGAGTITMGGYDYHTGDRSTGEVRDERAGRCIGACLEYAARKNMPLMIYVFSDGSVFSNGMLDDSMAGRGKGVWTGDDQQTACSFFLVYNPGGRPQLIGANADEQARHQQLGFMRPSGDVETAGSPAANNVNLLVETVVLNYMALHGQQNQFSTLFRGHGLGNATMMDRLTAFQPIVNGTIGT